MAAFFLGLLSLALAAVGGLAIWLGFDDRNQGFLIAGAVGISGGCVVLAVALLLREFRKTRSAFEIAAVRVAAAMPDHPVAVRPPPAGGIAPTPAARDGAVAALAAELDSAPRAAPSPPPARPEEAPPQKPAEPIRRFDRATAGPFVRRAPAEPAAATGATAPKGVVSTKSTIASAAPSLAPDTPGAAPAAAAHARDVVAPVAPHRADAKAGAPDIDSILDEIIAARDRSHATAAAAAAVPASAAAPTPAASGPASVVDRLAGLKAKMLSGLPSPEALRAAEDRGGARREDREERPRPGTPSSPRGLVGPALPESPREAMAADADATPDDQFHEQTDSASAGIPQPAAHATEDDARDDAPQRNGQSESPPAPGFIVAAEAPAKTAPPVAAPVQERAAPVFPVVNDEPEPPPGPKMVRSFTSGPNRYTMYDDGSIDADTPTGKLNFSSFDELRKFIDEKMGASRAGGARSG